jgi:glycosyltransferase involved in cell wall biosynthesis
MMAKGKIIQVCAVDVTMDKLLRELNMESIRDGYDVIGVCTKGNVTEKLITEGFNITNINIERRVAPLSNIKSIIEMYRLFKKEKPDIVHVHTPIAAVLGRVAARLANVPNIIYTAHGFYFHENMKPLAYKITVNIEKCMARFFTDYLFTQSQEDADSAAENRFMNKEKIKAIGNGVDIWYDFNPENINIEEIKLLENELNINPKDKIITFIGRLVREKGILDILEAFNRLDKDNVKLIVVGDIFQGDRDFETVKTIEKYKNNKNIIFTGIRSDINNILYVTDIFCLPSYREGMPRSIIEAMSMECAVVATNIRGCREEVVDGITGYMVRLRDCNDIRDKILTILSNENLLQSMKVNGRKRTEELYDERKVVRLQLNVFEKLLRERS